MISYLNKKIGIESAVTLSMPLPQPYLIGGTVMDRPVISKRRISSQVKKTCKQCGKEFEGLSFAYKGKDFCSKQCRISFRKSTILYQECVGCGNQFKVAPTHAGKVKYCSKQCRLKHVGDRFVYDNCIYCNKEFRVYLSWVGKHKYCSKQCRDSHVKETFREERTCKECGNVFLAYKSQDTLFCSHECYSKNKCSVDEKVCIFCGVKFKPKGGGVGKYCSADCYYKDNDKKPSIEMECANCGKLVQVQQYRLTRNKNVCCSKKCSDQFKGKDRLSAVCKTCGKTFYHRPSENRIFCSNYCLYKHRFEEKYKSCVEQIGFAVEVRRNPQGKLLIEVKCAYCGKWHNPKGQTLNSTVCGTKFHHYDAKFYCSEGCKEACPVFNQKDYPKGFKVASSREVSPDLRHMCLERDGWKCQKCGKSEPPLHCHHIEGATQNKMISNDIDNVITLCKSCHKEIHKQEGCKYHELQCKQ